MPVPDSPDPLQSRAAATTRGQPQRGPMHSDPLQRAVTAEELAPIHRQRRKPSTERDEI
jgi:hypothetical protein